MVGPFRDEFAGGDHVGVGVKLVLPAGDDGRAPMGRAHGDDLPAIDAPHVRRVSYRRVPLAAAEHVAFPFVQRIHHVEPPHLPTFAGEVYLVARRSCRHDLTPPSWGLGPGVCWPNYTQYPPHCGHRWSLAASSSSVAVHRWPRLHSRL